MDPSQTQQQQTTADQSSGNLFNIGRTVEADKKKKNPEKQVEERIKQTFNIAGGDKDQQDELKRKREDYAVQLRKKKK